MAFISNSTTRISTVTVSFLSILDHWVTHSAVPPLTKLSLTPCNGKQVFPPFTVTKLTVHLSLLEYWGYDPRNFGAACQCCFQVRYLKGHHLSVNNYHSAMKSAEGHFIYLDMCLWPCLPITIPPYITMNLGNASQLLWRYKAYMKKQYFLLV